MKPRFLRPLVSSLVFCAAAAQGAPVSAVATGPWATATTWSNTAVPATGNSYTIDGFTVTSPSTSNTIAFAGDALAIKKTGASAGVLDLYRGHDSSIQTVNTTLPDITMSDGATLQFRSSNGGNNFNLNASTDITTSGTVLINNTGGNWTHQITLNGTLSGSGLINYKTANCGSSVGSSRSLTLKAANSGYSGNWFVQHVNTGDDYGSLQADAANALGTGSVTLDDRARLINNAANGINSLAGVTLQKATAFLTLNAANAWNNATASLSLAAGTVTLASSNSVIGALTATGSAVINSTGGTLTASTITVSAGTLSGTGMLVPATSGTITNGAATVATSVNTALDFSNAGVIVTANDATLNGNSDIFFGGNVSGAGGFTKMGAGSLAFNATATISGLVTASAGSINFNNATAKSFTGGLAGSGTLNIGSTGLVTLSGASASFTGNINVADGAALAGEANTNGTLTLGATTGANLWPDFSTPGGFTANYIVLNGTNTIRFLTPPTAGAYTLLKYNGTLSGTGSFSAPFRGASVNNTGGVGGTEIVLTIGTPVSLIWNNAAADSLWNSGGSANWLNVATNDVFYDADTVVFNDIPGLDQAIVVSGVVSPGGITFPTSNDTVNYSFTGDGISGLTSLIKSGDATVTLGMANTYSGGTTLNEGRLRVGNDTALGSATVTINGGALATDGATSRALANPILLAGNATLGSAGDTGVLTLAGAVTLSGGARTVTAASDAVISGAIGGAFGLTKSGSGTLSLTNTNTHATTTVDGGVLQVGIGGTTGVIPATATITSLGTLRYFRSENGVTLANTFTGDGTLAFKGTGTSNQSSYSLTGTNTGLTGTLEIGTGARVLSTTAAQLGSAANVNIASGGQLYLNGGTYANTFNIAGSGWTETPGQIGALRINGTITGPVALTAAARIAPYSGSGTISGPLTGTADLEINATTSASFTGTLNYSGDGSLFTGATTVSQGTLNLTGTLGGSLAVSSTAYVATLAGEGSIAGALTLGAVGKNANLTINPTTAGAFTAAGAFAPAEAVTVVTVSFSPAPSAAGTYTVLNYASTTAVAANFALAPGYRAATFDTTTSGTATTVTTTAENLTWLGTSAVWDIDTTANWKSATVNPEKFYQLDSVTFDESGGNFNPTLAVTVSPTSVTFTNPATDYTLTGAGVIGGVATLTKNGGKSLTLSTPNTYTGNVTVNGGKLVQGNAAALGAAGSKTVTVNATAQLDFNGISPGTTRAYSYKIAGDGDGTGVLTNSSGTSVGANSGIANLELLADATVGGASRFDIAWSGVSGTIIGNGHTLTKVGANQIQLRGDATDLPTIIVNGGTLGAESSDLALGGAAGNVTVNTTGILGSYGVRSISTPVTLNDGATLSNLGGGAGTWTGTLSTSGSVTVNPAGQTIHLSGTLAGTGTITVPAAGGILNLSGTNTFNGGLIITHATNNTATTVNLPATYTLAVAAAKPIRVGNNTGTGANAAQTFNVAGTVTNDGTLFVGRSGLLNVNSGAVWTQNGDMTVAGQGGYTATMNVAAGADFTYAGTTPIKINPGSSGYGYLYIDGVFTTSRGFETTVVGGTIYLVTLRNGGTLKLSASVAELTTGTTNKTQFALGTGGGIIDTNGFSTAIASNISGTGNGLTKKGAGKLTLSGTNGYTGATLLNEGTLGGNGAAGSALTAATDTTLAPGASIGTFLAAGATLSSGATLAIEINSTTDTADKLVSTAAVDITGAAVTFAEIGSGTIPAGTKLVLIDYTGTTLAGTFSGYAEGAPISVGANTFTLSYADSSKVTLTSTTVSGYGSWASTKGLTVLNNGMGQNPDNDGMDNLLEYVLGGDPLVSDPAILPGAVPSGTNLIFTYHRSDDSETDTTQIIEYGNNLIGWTPVTVPAASATVSGLGFAIDEGSPTTAPDTVVVTIPTGGAPGFFARLKVTNP